MLRLSDYALEKIEKIPGESGWWNNSSCEIFTDTGEKLLRKGFKEDDVLIILEDLYSASQPYNGD